jgi:hypothetical protein
LFHIGAVQLLVKMSNHFYFNQSDFDLIIKLEWQFVSQSISRNVK